MKNLQRILKRESLSLKNNKRLEEGKVYELSGEKTEEDMEITVRDKFTGKRIFTEIFHFPWESNEDHRSFKFKRTCFIYNKSETINIYRDLAGKDVITKRLVIN